MNLSHFLAASSLLGSAFLSGCGDGTQAIGNVDSETQPRADLTRVQVVQPEVTTLQRTTSQPVTVSPYHVASIVAKVSGYLAELHADIGDTVNKGDTLATLDLPEMVKEIEEQQAVINQLQAAEQQANANVLLAEATVSAAQAALTQSESETEQADADLKAEEVEYRRIEELVSRRTVEARMEDEARLRLESARAGKSAANAAVATARANVAVAQAKLAVAKSDVDRARAETVVSQKRLEKMETLMQFGSLIAPFDGVVSGRNIDLGDLVSNAQAANGQRVSLFTIHQVDRVRVRAAIPEVDAPWTSVGDAATVRFSALRGQLFEGAVSRITRSLDASTRTMLVEIDLPNSDGHLLPGMYGEATLILDETAEALVLPASAVRFDAAGKSFVYTVADDGSVSVVDVLTGIDDGHHIEIRGGVRAGDRVIQGMLDRLVAGQQVQVDR